MVALEFSEWPGAWERQVIRRARCPQFFLHSSPPTTQELAQAQLLDQSELTQLESELAGLVSRCTGLTETADIGAIQTIKTDLDRCYDTACGMGADLSEQKEALTLLNEVITTAIRRTLRDDDEQARLKLIKQESVRMRHLTRLTYPIVCDLLRTVSPIPESDFAAAMLCETDEAFTVALEVLDQEQKRVLAEGIETIASSLAEKANSTGATRKLQLLQKTLTHTQESALPDAAEIG
jgi:hypothetical protein